MYMSLQLRNFILEHTFILSCVSSNHLDHWEIMLTTTIMFPVNPVFFIHNLYYFLHKLFWEYNKTKFVRCVGT